jgi:hypothetical protein
MFYYKDYRLLIEMYCYPENFREYDEIDNPELND